MFDQQRLTIRLQHKASNICPLTINEKLYLFFCYINPTLIAGIQCAHCSSRLIPSPRVPRSHRLTEIYDILQRWLKHEELVQLLCMWIVEIFLCKEWAIEDDRRHPFHFQRHSFGWLRNWRTLQTNVGASIPAALTLLVLSRGDFLRRG